jgi:hypothetical protein
MTPARSFSPKAVAFGLVSLAVGVGTGYLMCAHPEGLNPQWPLWMALFAPASFAAAGMHLLAMGLGFPRLSAHMLAVVAVGILAVANFAAFFTTHFQSWVTVSFLGVALVSRPLDETTGRHSLRAIMVAVDTFVIAILVLAWRNSRKATTPPAS